MLFAVLFSVCALAGVTATDAWVRGTVPAGIEMGQRLRGYTRGTFEWLKKAEEAGFSLENYLSSDDDLDSLRSDPRWSALRKESRAKHLVEHKEKAAGAAKRLVALRMPP